MKFPGEVGAEIDETFEIGRGAVEGEVQAAFAAEVVFFDDPIDAGRAFAPGDATPVVTGSVFAEVAEFRFSRASEGAGTVLELIQDLGKAGLFADRRVEGLGDAHGDAGAADAEAEGEAGGKLDDDGIGNATATPDHIDGNGGTVGGFDDRDVEAPADGGNEFESESGEPGFAVFDD